MSAGDFPARWIREEGECPCSRELREHGTVTKQGPAPRFATEVFPKTGNTSLREGRQAAPAPLSCCHQKTDGNMLPRGQAQPQTVGRQARDRTAERRHGEH